MWSLPLYRGRGTAYNNTGSSLGTKLPVVGHISNKAFVSRNQVSGKSTFFGKSRGRSHLQFVGRIITV